MDNPFVEISNQIKDLKLLIMGMNQTKQPEVKWYSIKEAASILGCTYHGLYRLVQSGKVPSKNIGRKIVIPASYLNNSDCVGNSLAGVSNNQNQNEYE